MISKDELKAMSRKELEKLLNSVSKALASAKARDQREAKKAAAKAAAEFGFSLGEISEADGTVQKKTKAKKAPKSPQSPLLRTQRTKRRPGQVKGVSQTGIALRSQQALSLTPCAFDP